MMNENHDDDDNNNTLTFLLSDNQQATTIATTNQRTAPNPIIIIPIRTPPVSGNTTSTSSFAVTTTTTPTISRISSIDTTFVDTATPNLNLQAIHGIRCIACYCVMIFHIHFFHGSTLFLRTSSCLLSVHRNTAVPFISNFFLGRITFHMTLFWLLSGFLCEYKLHQIVIKRLQANHAELPRVEDDMNITISISWKQYFMFFSNRLLRLYPLYILLQLITYADSKIQSKETRATGYTSQSFLLSLLFIKPWTDETLNLAATGWSVQVDIHGYIALILLFALTYKHTYVGNSTTKPNTSIKRYILITWYVLSIIHVLSYRPLPSQRLPKAIKDDFNKYGLIGIDAEPDTQVIELGLDWHREKMYPKYDFDNDTIHAIRYFRSSLLNDTYFTSIMNHGSAFMLGSLLYVSLYERDWEPYYPGYKLLLCILLLLITDGWYSLSGLPMYLMLDAILTIKRMNNINDTELYSATGLTRAKIRIEISFNIIMTQTVKFLSNPIFRMLSPYTYGIYLFHVVVVFVRIYSNLLTKIAIVGEGAEHDIDACLSLEHSGFKYDLIFVARESVIVFLMILPCSIILRWVIEKPFFWLRKQWYQQK